MPWYLQPLPALPPQVRPIGMFSLDNNGSREDKIIAVHVDDPVYREYTDINQVPSHRMAEIKSFFEDYQLNEDRVS
jgi:inorganic pyrophosphatase